MIFPATEREISKYTQQRQIIIRETATDYERVVSPYIASIPRTDVQWVYNILEGRSEQDRIIHIFEDAKYGFVLLPDFKFDASQPVWLTIVLVNRTVIN